MVEENGETTKKEVQKWTYDPNFKEYILLLGSKGEPALESIDNYPSRIELNLALHSALDHMRSETQEDNDERFSVVGFAETVRDLYIPDIAIKGEPYQIPPSIIVNTIGTAKEKHGVTSIPGDLHTHSYTGPLTFSDFYGMLVKHRSHVPMMRGLANPTENIFAFRTRETYMVEDFGIPTYMASEGFREYWMKKSGFKLSNKQNHIRRTRPTADMWQTNIAIAQAHRLALYRGRPGEDLIRTFP